MADVASNATLDLVQLQMDEFAQQAGDLDDAAFAYRLQLQEALRASAPSAEVDCTVLSDCSHADEAVVGNQLQVQVWFPRQKYILLSKQR